MKVKDICDLHNGRAFKPGDWGSEGLPIIRIQNLNDEKAPFNYFSGEHSPVHEINDGDLLFSWSGTPGTSFGAFRWRRGKGVLNQHIFKILPKIEVDKEYLKYALNGNINTIIAKAHGGVGLQHITKKELDEIDIPIIALPDQLKAVDRISSAEKMIAMRKLELQKLDELVKARFIELFGDYDLTHPQESWVTIKEIGTVVGGATPKTDHDEYWGGSHRWITPAELDADSGYIYDSVRKLTKAGVESCSLQEMPVGTVFLSSRAPIGKVAIAGNTFYCNQGFKNIICKEDITPRYLYTVLLLNVEYLNSLGRGATFKEISKGIVENIRIPVPAMELQKQFAAFVEQTDKSKVAVQKALDEAQLLLDSLMQKYFG